MLQMLLSRNGKGICLYDVQAFEVFLQRTWTALTNILHETSADKTKSVAKLDEII